MDVPLNRKQHVSNDRYAGAAPPVVHDVHLPDADIGADSHQPRAGENPPFGDRAEVVHLHFNRGETPRSGKVTLQRAAHGRVGDAGRNAAVNRTGAVQQLRPHAALDGEAVAMKPDQLKAEQVVEGVPGEDFANTGGGAPGVVRIR